MTDVEIRLIEAWDAVTTGLGDEIPEWLDQPTVRVQPLSRRSRRPLAIVGVAAAAIVAVGAFAVTRDRGEPAAPASAGRTIVLGEAPMVWPEETSDLDRSDPAVVASAFADQVLGMSGATLGVSTPGTPGPDDLEGLHVPIIDGDTVILLGLERRATGWYVADVGADQPAPSFARINGGELRYTPPPHTAAVLVSARTTQTTIERLATANELRSHVINLDDVIITFLLIYMDEQGQTIGAQGSSAESGISYPSTTGSYTATTAGEG